MEVLCLNPAFCMRAYRQLKALHGLGCEIDLRYMGFGQSLTEKDHSFLRSKAQIFQNNYPLSHFPRTLVPSIYRRFITRTVSEGDFEIVLVHNMPDILGVAAVRYSGLPVVFDERDMVSSFQRDLVLANYIPPALRGSSLARLIGLRTVHSRLLRLEGEVLNGSAARTWVSGHTLDMAIERHGIPRENNLIFPNYASRDDLKPPLPKLSGSDGEMHIVYEGVLANEGYRAPLLELFEKIASIGVHIHIYGIGPDDVMQQYRGPEKDSPCYHFHGGLPHDRLMEEMPQYDWGLIPFIPPKEERDHFDTMLPNKFFDYLACGIPVLCPGSVAMVNYIERERVGAIFESIGDIKTLAEGNPPKFDREGYIIESHIGEMFDLMKRVVNSS